MKKIISGIDMSKMNRQKVQIFHRMSDTLLLEVKKMLATN